MKSRMTIGLLSGMTLLALGSCNNIERDRKDVGTPAAVSMDGEEMSSEELEATQLTVLDANDQAQEDTVINPNTAVQSPEETFTETEVVRIDTISTRIVYDVRRRTIEEVDTVGATKTYEIKKTVLKRTVMLDTLTQTEDEQQTVAFQKGDFKKLDEQVESDTAVEIIDYQSSKQQPASTQSSASEQNSSANNSSDTTEPTQSDQARETQSNATQSDEAQPNETQSSAGTQSEPSTSPRNSSDTADSDGSARNNASEQSEPESRDQSPQSGQEPQARDTQTPTNSDREQPSSSSATDGTAKQDTTRRSDSGS